jgi:hypothetical protein
MELMVFFLIGWKMLELGDMILHVPRLLEKPSGSGFLGSEERFHGECGTLHEFGQCLGLSSKMFGKD